MAAATVVETRSISEALHANDPRYVLLAQRIAHLIEERDAFTAECYAPEKLKSGKPTRGAQRRIRPAAALA